MKILLKLIIIFFVMIGILSVPIYAATIYVDQSVPVNTSTQYDPQTRTCGSGISRVYNTIKGAVAGMAVGDKIMLREGVYREGYISLPSSKNGTSWEEGCYNMMASYPGEWAVLDGENNLPNTHGNVAVMGNIISCAYWKFERLEICNGRRADGDRAHGFYADDGPFIFRYCYIHDNYTDNINDIPGGIVGHHWNDCLIEYCYFKDNGTLTGSHWNASHITIYSDYKDEEIARDGFQYIGPGIHTIRNIYRYNLFEGGASGMFNTKNQQCLTGRNAGVHGYDDTYKNYGDNVHHNIFRNMGQGIECEQDFQQIYNNIFDNCVKGFTINEANGSGSGSYKVIAYNNTFINCPGIGILARQLNKYTTTTINTEPKYYGYVLNNIFDQCVYDNNKAQAEEIGLYLATTEWPEAKFDEFIVDRNYSYRPRSHNYDPSADKMIYLKDTRYTIDEFKTLRPGVELWMNAYDASNELYQGTSGAAKYKTRGEHVLSCESTIANSGIGGSHPYLDGVTLPSYIGAVNPTDNDWVDGVLGLATISNLQNGNEGDAPWIENIESSPDNTAPSTPSDLLGLANSQTEINLNWTASIDNIEVDGYRIYRDGIEVGTCATNSYTDNGLTSGTTYNYTVAAYDTSGNESPTCPSVSITTLENDERTSVINDTPMIITSPMTKAYPGIEYNVRLGVIGGKYPYSFNLLTAPAEMNISGNGTISWTPEVNLSGQSFAVEVRVTDKLSQSVNQSFTISVTTDGFYFVAPHGNDTTGTGSINSPWATINKGLSSGVTGDTLYVRGGTYVQKWQFATGKLNRIVAYPSESPIADFDFQPGPGITTSDTYIDGFEIKNITFKAFQVSSDADRLVFRRNHMHHLYDTSVNENPSFVFFWDETNKQYTNVVFQENLFHDIFDRASGLHGDNSANYHAASTTWYNVGWSLYEDNEAYNIDGRGVSDKDDGYKNTIRNNIFHDCQTGIGLYNQKTQIYIEVNYNLIYDCSNEGITLGGMGGYLQDISIYRNTVIGNVYFSCMVDVSDTKNINIFNNIIGNSTGLPYAIWPMKINHDDGSYHYEYPNWFQNSNPKVRIADNLVWGRSTSIAGYSWGIPATNWTIWQSHGYDVDGILADPGLDANYALAQSSPYYGIYGRDIDSAAPSVPSNLSGTAASQTQINLTWAASTDNVGVTGYRIYRNGAQVGSSATTNYSDSGLNANTTYSYKIEAYDAAGNLSPKSTEVIVTTPSAQNEAPVIEAILNQNVYEGELLTFDITVNDANPNDTITLTPNNIPEGATLTQTATRTFRFSWQTNFSGNANSPYTVIFSANDGIVNSAAVSVVINVQNVSENVTLSDHPQWLRTR